VGLAKALQYASAVGGLATTATGAMDGLPTAADVETLVAGGGRGE